MKVGTRGAERTTRLTGDIAHDLGGGKVMGQVPRTPYASSIKTRQSVAQQFEGPPRWRWFGWDDVDNPIHRSSWLGWAVARYAKYMMNICGDKTVT